MSARVRRAELGRGAVEIDGAKNVEHLDDDILVAARLSGPDRVIGQHYGGIIIGAGQQDGDFDSQREGDVCPIAALLMARQSRSM